MNRNVKVQKSRWENCKTACNRCAKHALGCQTWHFDEKAYLGPTQHNTVENFVIMKPHEVEGLLSDQQKLRDCSAHDR